MPRQTFMMVGESEWCIVVIIFPYQSLCYLCLWTVHGPLSNPAINRKPWHGQKFFLYFMINKKLLRSYLCFHWIYIWLYVVILVIALLILNSFKAFDSWRVKIIIFKQKGTIQTFKWRNVSECSFETVAVEDKILRFDIIFVNHFRSTDWGTEC